MSATIVHRPGVSVIRPAAALKTDTNSSCHGYTGGVKANKKHVMRSPTILPVCWGQYYQNHPRAVTLAAQLITDLVTGPFMNNLVQYAIGPGSLAGPAVTISPDPADMNWDVSGTNDRDQLIAWLDDGTIPTKPAKDETNLTYCIFLPPNITLSNGKDKKGNLITDVCGWHGHANYKKSSGDANLFWAVIKTVGASFTTEQDHVNSVAYCVSHELAEAFTNRDGGGYFSDNGCEIGDICETQAFYQTRGWTVEQYWSGWDNACVRGDKPVSLRRFLKAVNFDPKNGLRALKTSAINLQYIASRM